MVDKPTSLRFNDEDKKLIKKLMDHNGQSLIMIVRAGLRALAREWRIK